MSVLFNSDRRILKATHTPIAFVATASAAPSRAHDKAALIRGLQLRSGEVDAVRADLAARGDAPLGDQTVTTLRAFEPQTVGILVPRAATLADVPVDALTTFCRAVLAHREAALVALTGPPAAQVTPPAPAATAPAGTSTSAARTARSPAPSQAPARAVAPPEASMLHESNADLALASSLVTFASGALDAFTNGVAISPIGMLHLERIEMAPAGIERGELLATIPLAPGETTSVVQKEWAVTDEEYSSIVTDALENYTEKGVTEKAELADATTSETKHNQQLSLAASLSGSYGFVTFSANTNFSDSLSTDQSEKASRTHSTEVTSKAASRVRKERKVTIQTSSTSGQSETTTRTLTNTSTTDSMRIDYFSMMRKWEVRLLQYGLRLTYDIAIPEPGAALREQLATLATLNKEIGASFVFDLDPATISRNPTDPGYYLKLANDYGASVPTPPPLAIPPVATMGNPPGVNQGSWGTAEINITAPPSTGM